MVIILAGPDSYRSLQRLEHLRAAFRAKHDPTGLNTVTLDGETATKEELRDATGSSGLFARRRMVIVDQYNAKRAALTPAGFKEVLGPFTGGDEVVVIVRDVTPRSQERGRRAESVKPAIAIPSAKVESFPVFSNLEAERWLSQAAKERGGGIEAKAAKVLVAMVGVDTWRLSMELDKLLAYADGRGIALADVETLAVGRLESDVFGFLDAVGQRQKAIAVRLLHQELASGTNELALVAAIMRHVENLVNVLALQPASPSVIAKKLDIHPYVATKAAAQAKRFTRAELIRWHAALFEVESQLKSTPLDAETLLSIFLIADYAE